MALFLAGRADAQLQLQNQIRSTLPRVVVASGGPYSARDQTIQQFNGYINVPNEYLGQPLSLVATNGSYSRPGYSWVRLFLRAGAVDASWQDNSQYESLGKLLIDEHSFESTSQVYIDLSTQLRKGPNAIFVEGAGPPGAVFSWEIRSIGTPYLAQLNPTVTAAGVAVTFSGQGFSSRPDENIAQLGPLSIPVLHSDLNAIQVLVPASMPSGVYDFSVAIRGYRSNLLRLQVINRTPKSTSR